MLRPALSTRRLACLLALGAGCSSGPAAIDAPDGYTKLDDMEGSSQFIEWTPPAGMSPGPWGTATDCTEADRIAPPPYTIDPRGWSYAQLPAPHETFPGIVSTHAVHFRTTSPLVGVWGANVGFDFAYAAGSDAGPPPPPQGSADAGAPAAGQPCTNPSSRDFPGVPVDLSAYSGITFWGMSGGPGVKVRVLLRDVNSDPRGGICNASDPTVETNCYNGFGAAVTLTSTMTRYTLDFADLSQNLSWGYHPDPDVLDVRHVYDLMFEFDLASCTSTAAFMCAGGDMPSASFDFWIDDLYLVKT
jgi:hypothetical protein